MQGIIVAETGWSFEQLSDQPDWLLDLVYAIIVIDKQMHYKQLESLIKLWSKKH